MAWKDLKNAELAERVAVHPVTVSQWRTEKQLPDDDTLASLSRELSTTPAWLRFGEGTAPWEVQGDQGTGSAREESRVVPEPEYTTGLVRVSAAELVGAVPGSRDALRNIEFYFPPGIRLAAVEAATAFLRVALTNDLTGDDAQTEAAVRQAIEIVVGAAMMVSDFGEGMTDAEITGFFGVFGIHTLSTLLDSRSVPHVEMEKSPEAHTASQPAQTEPGAPQEGPLDLQKWDLSTEDLKRLATPEEWATAQTTMESSRAAFMEMHAGLIPDEAERREYVDRMMATLAGEALRAQQSPEYMAYYRRGVGRIAQMITSLYAKPGGDEIGFERLLANELKESEAMEPLARRLDAARGLSLTMAQFEDRETKLRAGVLERSLADGKTIEEARQQANSLVESLLIKPGDALFRRSGDPHVARYADAFRRAALSVVDASIKEDWSAQRRAFDEWDRIGQAISRSRHAARSIEDGTVDEPSGRWTKKPPAGAPPNDPDS